ncbi:hypothetical protein NL529_30450, partial [Klebsiella pneumoniae]|nr:hypothetical protein [Klebsiella pneumoniae]
FLTTSAQGILNFLRMMNRPAPQITSHRVGSLMKEQQRSLALHGLKSGDFIYYDDAEDDARPQPIRLKHQAGLKVLFVEIV